jgi:transcriptional regulator with XRE-family HTH domain
MNVGTEIRRRRQEQGLTGAQLAARAGMAPSAVSQIETGRRVPSSASVAKLAEALGIEAGALFRKSQESLPSPAAAEMEATLRTIRENLAVLEEYFENPPDEVTADEAINLFYGLMPKPLEHLSLMNPDEMRRYIGEVREVFEDQTRINRQLEAWNIAQYGRLHKEHA